MTRKSVSKKMTPQHGKVHKPYFVKLNMLRPARLQHTDHRPQLRGFSEHSAIHGIELKNRIQDFPVIPGKNACEIAGTIDPVPPDIEVNIFVILRVVTVLILKVKPSRAWLPPRNNFPLRFVNLRFVNRLFAHRPSPRRWIGPPQAVNRYSCTVYCEPGIFRIRP